MRSILLLTREGSLHNGLGEGTPDLAREWRRARRETRRRSIALIPLDILVLTDTVSSKNKHIFT